ncbi:MAG: hypothetical protein ACFFDN_42985, partial [Candidatus Hodarchaeota archaeon]
RKDKLVQNVLKFSIFHVYHSLKQPLNKILIIMFFYVKLRIKNTFILNLINISARNIIICSR